MRIYRAGWLAAAWLLTAASPTWALGVWRASVSNGVGSEVTVTLTNASAQQAWALVPGSILDTALVEDVFTVSGSSGLQNGTYTGPVAKRRQPVATDYRLFEPGEAVTQQVNLAALYRVAVSGVYDAQLLQHLEYRLAQPSTATGSGETSLPTHEQILRSAPIAVNMAANTLSTRLQPPRFAACSAAQQSDIQLAGLAAEHTVSHAVADLSSLSPAQRLTSPRFTQWFGDHSDERFNEVELNFRNIERVLKDESLSFDCSCALQGVFAYVRVDEPYNVFLCPAFWRASVNGTDSRAGTIVHELSHFQIVAGTRDHVYGQTGASALAQTDPARAVQNADNHEYFAENTPELAISSLDESPPVDSDIVDVAADAVREEVVLDAGQRHVYRVDDVTRISVTPQSGDADLYVYADSVLRERLCGSANRGLVTDRCAPARAGRVYIDVRGVESGAYTLRTETATVGSNLATLVEDQPLLESIGQGERLTYRIEGAESVGVTSLSAVVNLYVLRDPDDPSSVVCASTGTVGQDACALPDDYTVLFPHVVGMAAGQFEIVAGAESVRPAGGLSARGAGGVGVFASLVFCVLALIARRAVHGVRGRVQLIVLAPALLVGCSLPPAVQAPDPPPGPRLVAVLEPIESRPSWVRFSVENRGTEAASVPVWGTPLESPLLGDYFTVQRGDVSLLYRGPMAKRSLDGSPVLTVSAGERVSADVDLSALYNLRPRSRFTAAFDPLRADGTIWLRQGVPLVAVEGRVNRTMP